jgi:hypothetical protein
VSHLGVTHEIGRHLSVRVGQVEIGRYVYAPDVPALEAPKPYLHPLRTLDGQVVTSFRPWDHRWHKGLQMTCSELSGQNFWGGPSFRDGAYVQLDNVGRMQHRAMPVLDVADDEVTVVEELDWITSAEERWVHETRTLRFHGVDTGADRWVLDFSTVMRNVRGRDLVMGSPTTLGRPNAGYTGLFWRGPRAWTGGEIIADGGRGGEEMMGRTGPWLAVTGRHDDSDGGGTVLFLAGTSSAPVPVTWFVRSAPFAAINTSPSFDTEVTIAPGEALELRHRVVVVGRVLTRDEIENLADDLALEAPVGVTTS